MNNFNAPTCRLISKNSPALAIITGFLPVLFHEIQVHTEIGFILLLVVLFHDKLYQSKTSITLYGQL